MKSLHIITPVKDSIEYALEAIRAVKASKLDIPYTYTIYNDFSTPENTEILQKESKETGFRLVNLSDHIDHPSPNYLWVLQTARKEALENDAALVIVESDVVIKNNTLQKLFEAARDLPRLGIAAALTTDEKGQANYPYIYAKKWEENAYAIERHLSFCCSLLSPKLMKEYDFALLNPGKNWYDVTISHKALKMGFQNYLFTNIPVLHHPHGSRPWKLLKRHNPLKYYWLKFIKHRDKI